MRILSTLLSTFLTLAVFGMLYSAYGRAADLASLLLVVLVPWATWRYAGRK